MKRLTWGFVIVWMTGSLIAQSVELQFLLARDTEITLKMAETLTSKRAYINERVELVTASDVLVSGELLVPKNTRVLGTVVVGNAKEKDGKNSHDVAIRVDYIRLGDRRILLTGTQSSKGKVSTGAVVVGTALLGLSGLLIAVDSRTGEIREGAEVKAYVAEGVELPVVRPSAGAEGVPAEKPRVQ